MQLFGWFRKPAPDLTPRVEALEAAVKAQGERDEALARLEKAWEDFEKAYVEFEKHVNAQFNQINEKLGNGSRKAPSGRPFPTLRAVAELGERAQKEKARG